MSAYFVVMTYTSGKTIRKDADENRVVSGNGNSLSFMQVLLGKSLENTSQEFYVLVIFWWELTMKKRDS